MYLRGDLENSEVTQLEHSMNSYDILKIAPAPDFSQFMVTADNDIRIYSLDDDRVNYSNTAVNGDISKKRTVFQRPTRIYSLDYYPFFDGKQPATNCFLVSCSEEHVVLQDSTGYKRATYKTLKNDEIATALTVKFGFDGTVYAGLNEEMQLFDIDGRGKDIWKLSPSKKSPDGLKGLVTDIKFNVNLGLTTIGTNKSLIGFYDVTSGSQIDLFQSNFGNGISQLEWSKSMNYLVSFQRKSSKLQCWDIRNPEVVLYTIDRNADTNQRLYSCISNEDCFFGDVHGAITKLDLKTGKTNIIWRDRLERPVNNIAVDNKGDFYVTCGQREFVLKSTFCHDDASDSADETSIQGSDLYQISNLLQKS